MSGYDRVVQPAAGDEALENHLGGDEAKNYRQYEFDMVAPHVGPVDAGDRLGPRATSPSSSCPGSTGSWSATSTPTAWSSSRSASPTATTSTCCSSACRPRSRSKDKVDTVVMMNVLEHIEEDVEALRSLAKVTAPRWPDHHLGARLHAAVRRLRPQGRPRHPLHPRHPAQTVSDGGLDIDVLKPINFLGGIAWWAAVRRGGVGYPDPAWSRSTTGRWSRPTRFIERFIRPPFGQTVFCVARVPEVVPGNDTSRSRIPPGRSPFPAGDLAQGVSTTWAHGLVPRPGSADRGSPRSAGRSWAAL